ncbi:MAG TPA: hypothetical protein VOA88_17400 [Candidatus Dormibacteraeota bacterium]|nr:hypothetical protein [Candidatus Dormibacteraeota bacterium]
MRRIAGLSPLLVVIFVFVLALPQFAFAQRLKPIPHPIGVMQHPAAQAATQTGPEAHAQVRAAASTASASTSPWAPLTNQPNFLIDGASNPILLTDGTVLIQDTAFPDWWKLTPDKFGSYVNGTWSQVASLPATYSPLYHSSAVLPDGRLIIEGGEYLLSLDQTELIPTWTPQGSIYDPIANTWTPVAPPPFFTGFGSFAQTIGDAQSVVLPNGTYMQANCCTLEQALLDAKTLTWTQTGSNKFDINDEEGWTLLPNGKVLTVDAYVPVGIPYIPDGTNSEIYNPHNGKWSSAGSTIVQLWDSNAACGGFTNNTTFEVGPAVLRPDGTVFYTGSNTCPGAAGNTAIYNSTNGKWTAGPQFPAPNNIADGPAALEPNGKVLMFASPSFGAPPATFFEWDGQSLNAIPGTPNAPVDGSFVGNMLVLPTGQILFTDFSNDVEIFTPTPGHPKSAEPTLLFTPIFLKRGQSYQAFGFQFNGVSQGAAYGDDIQAATNYPLVRITNIINGNVQFARTHDHSTMAVASNGLVSTHFDVSANQEPCICKLEVVANGIASNPVFVFVH